MDRRTVAESPDTTRWSAAIQIHQLTCSHAELRRRSALGHGGPSYPHHARGALARGINEAFRIVARLSRKALRHGTENHQANLHAMGCSWTALDSRVAGLSQSNAAHGPGP